MLGCCAYTIGLSELTGIELILAGAVIYYHEEVTQIINNVHIIEKSGYAVTSRQCVSRSSDTRFVTRIISVARRR